MPKHAEAMQRIQAFIHEKGLSPGDKLPSERRLAVAFSVSRNSVREAIRALAEQGHLLVRPGDGTYVQEPEAEVAALLQKSLNSRRQRSQEVFDLRRILEPGLAELAAKNATSVDIARLKALVFDQQRARETGQDGQHLDTAFHMQLARATHNQVLLEVMLALHDILGESRADDLQRRERQDHSPRAHFAIVDAVEKRDPEGARQAMERHIQEAQAFAFGVGSEPEAPHAGATGHTEQESEQ